MDRARLSRSGRTAGVGVWGPRLAMLFVRSWERGERVAAAMAARGFAGRFPQGEERRWGARDYGFAAAGLLFALPLLWGWL